MFVASSETQFSVSIFIAHNFYFCRKLTRALLEAWIHNTRGN